VSRLREALVTRGCFKRFQRIQGRKSAPHVTSLEKLGVPPELMFCLQREYAP
jgi:hypothetical protein